MDKSILSYLQSKQAPIDIVFQTSTRTRHCIKQPTSRTGRTQAFEADQRPESQPRRNNLYDSPLHHSLSSHHSPSSCLAREDAFEIRTSRFHSAGEDQCFPSRTSSPKIRHHRRREQSRREKRCSRCTKELQHAWHWHREYKNPENS